MRLILVCGGQHYKNRDLVFEILDRFLFSDDTIISGGAKGVDTFAEDYAIESNIAFIKMEAEWETYGRGAGFIRNTEMLEQNPELVIAFPGGNGTQDTVIKAKRKRIPIIRVSEDGTWAEL